MPEGWSLLILPSFKLQYAVKHMRVKYRRFRRQEVIPIAVKFSKAANKPTEPMNYNTPKSGKIIFHPLSM